ncbi:DUF4271 domain-containing protein [Dysgonomonas sp. 521]|nr:DUF4271 domain-containing protein [Dysgonomonas sp. 521]
MGDSVATQDTISRHTFSFDPVKGEIVDATTSQMNASTEHNPDDIVRHSGERLPFNLEQTDGIFCLLVICILFFAHIYNGGVSFLKENIAYLFSPQKASRLHNQTTVKETIYSYFLVFQAVALIAICIYDIFIDFETPGQSNGRPFVTIITFIVIIALFLGIKDVVYKIIGYIFNQQKTMDLWRKTYMVSVEILGIIYFIPTLFLIYSSYYHTQIFCFMLILFLIVQITLFYQIIVFFINQKFNFLYLIAYLCTFEILPYIFLSTALIYLYRTDVFNTLLWL